MSASEATNIKCPGKPGIQQGIECNHIDYYDIMVVGRTGMGKSSTTDKLLIANLTNQDYHGAQHSDPQVDIENCRLSLADIVIWILSDADFEMERMTLRLKNMVFFRSLENSHEEINRSREADMHVYASTKKCELLSNETTKVRVLDVPGFFGADALSGSTSSSYQNVQRTDVSIMRKILHIQTAMHMNFRRILYFLPQRGSLKRESADLKLEIETMAHYFGQSIFNSMVIVATFSSDVYDSVDIGKELFKPKHYEETKDHFREALKEVFRAIEGEEIAPLPDPPIVFISMFDTCEEILQKVKSTQVKCDHVQLSFVPTTCTRCGIKTKIITFNERGVPQKERVSCIYGSNWSSAIPYKETTCHPIMLPKYSTLSKIVGGIAHLMTFRVFWGKWPSFGNLDEVCVKCGQDPNSRGCMRINEKFTFQEESITVDHTNTIDEQFVIKTEDELSHDFNSFAPRGSPATSDSTHVHVYARQDSSYQIQAEGTCPTTEYSECKGT